MAIEQGPQPVRASQQPVDVQGRSLRFLHLQALLARVEPGFGRLELLQRQRGIFLRIVFEANGVRQFGRKLLIEDSATDSEVVQTAWLAVQLAVTHELREKFRVDGQSVFGPHLPIEDLIQFVSSAVPDERQPKLA